MNYRTTIRELRNARQGWIERLTANPDSLMAAQHIYQINAKIELLVGLALTDGKFEEIQ